MRSFDCPKRCGWCDTGCSKCFRLELIGCATSQRWLRSSTPLPKYSKHSVHFPSAGRRKAKPQREISSSMATAWLSKIRHQLIKRIRRINSTTIVRGRGRHPVPNSSIKEVDRFGEPKGSMCSFDSENWLPCTRGDFFDGVEDDVIWVDPNAARLSRQCK